MYMYVRMYMYVCMCVYVYLLIHKCVYSHRCVFVFIHDVYIERCRRMKLTLVPDCQMFRGSGAQTSAENASGGSFPGPWALGHSGRGKRLFTADAAKGPCCQNWT